MPSLNLYVWTEFASSYTGCTGGLAFALAVNEAEARELISESYRFSLQAVDWGILTIYPVTHRIGLCAPGGN